MIGKGRKQNTLPFTELVIGLHIISFVNGATFIATSANGNRPLASGCCWRSEEQAPTAEDIIQEYCTSLVSSCTSILNSVKQVFLLKASLNRLGHLLINSFLNTELPTVHSTEKTSFAVDGLHPSSSSYSDTLLMCFKKIRSSWL